MSHAHGTRLDGIVTLDDLRQRCVVDDLEDGGCWHLRTARGRPLPVGQRSTLWMHGIGHVTSTRAAWLLSHPGQTLRNGWVAFRRCSSYDCVAPLHISAATKQAWGKHMAATGKARTPAKTAAARAQVARLPQTKLTPELRQWLLESQQSGSAAAHALGITQGRANCIRAAYRAAQAARPAASVFELAMRAAA